MSKTKISNKKIQKIISLIFFNKFNNTPDFAVYESLQI